MLVALKTETPKFNRLKCAKHSYTITGKVNRQSNNKELKRKNNEKEKKNK